MKMLSIKKLNSVGVAHHFILALVVVLSIASFGAWRVFSSSAATAPNATTCKDPYYAQDHMPGCLSALGGSIIITSVGKGGDYVRTDKTHGFTADNGKRQVNLENPNYAFIKNVTGNNWKICNDARLQEDNCNEKDNKEYSLPKGTKINLCNIDVSNGGGTYACMLEDAYVRQR